MNVVGESRIGIREAWETFWFHPRSAEALSVMRILLGGLLIYNHVVWFFQCGAFFDPEGLLPVDYRDLLFGEGHGAWSLFDLFPAIVVHSFTMTVFVLFTVGWKTRYFAIASWVCVLSYANRTIGAQFGFDQIASFLIAYLAIGDSGRHFSVDAILNTSRPPRVSTGSSVSRSFFGERSMSEWNTLAIRLVQVHLCVVYLFAGLGKFQGVAWLNGEAVLMAFSSYEYQTLELTWLVHWMWLVNLLTLGSLFWELTYPVLIWNRWTRPFFLGMAIAVHLGIGLSMGMLTFGLIMIVANVSFIPEKLWGKRA